MEYCLSKLLSLTSYQQLPRANTLKDRQSKILIKGRAVQSLRFVRFQICLSLIHILPILYLFYLVAFFVFIYYLECVLHFPISSQFIFMINFASFLVLCKHGLPSQHQIWNVSLHSTNYFVIMSYILIFIFERNSSLRCY